MNTFQGHNLIRDLIAESLRDILMNSSGGVILSLMMKQYEQYTCSGQGLYRPLTDQSNSSRFFNLVVCASCCCAGDRGFNPSHETMNFPAIPLVPVTHLYRPNDPFDVFSKIT